MRLFSFRINVAIGAVGLAAFIAGCSGGGNSPLMSPIAAPTAGSAASPSSGTQYANVTFTIVWPASPSSMNRRRPDYISPSTKSISIAVNGGTPLVVANPNVSGGTTATAAPSTNVVVAAPVGADAFAVGDYDDTKAVGSLLAENVISYTVVSGAANVVPITLNGNLAKVFCSGGAPYTSPAGTIAATSPQAFTITGPAGQLNVIPEDADSNIIVAPGIVPSLALTAATPSQASISTTSTANTFTVNPTVVGTAVTLNVSGKSLTGSTITGSCTVTRQLAMYITNHFNNIVGSTAASLAAQSASVTIYPASATGSATPTAIIQGTNTQLAGVQFVAVDPAGNVFVSNTGPQPGAAFGPTSGFVSIYAAGTAGNVAPVNTIPNLNSPEGLAFDSNGMLYVLSIDRIQEFPASSDGVTATGAAASALATTVIAGSNTDLFSCYGIAVGADFTVAAACSDVADVFPPKSAGNAAPGVIEVVGMTAATFASDSWLGASLDSAGNLALTGANNNQDNATVYASTSLPSPGSDATPLPTTSTVKTDFSQPIGIAADSTGKYYVVNYGNNSMSTFTSVTTLELGTGTNNTLTGLNEPYGIAVR